MKITKQGSGGLFTDPDPDKARLFFRDEKRNARVMKSKIMPLATAIDRYVRNGDYLAIGGFGSNRTPIAACHEIVRQKKRNLGFLGHTSTHDMQILSSGEVYDRIDISYGVGLEARGLSKCSRAYLESGRVTVTEWTNYSLTARLKAASMGIPYLPARQMIGTDTFLRSAAIQSTCPFTGKELSLIPALFPDVSVIHVHEADCYGNARFKGIAVSDVELAHATKRLIITAERIVPHSEITRNPDSTLIPFHMVDAVCEVPYGAYPGGMPYEYFSDEDALNGWLAAEKTAEGFAEFLRREIYECRDHGEYVANHGGIFRMSELRNKELLIVNEGRA